MQILVVDFGQILQRLNKNNISTKKFEIFYDICRLLEIPISKEACFKLYSKYVDNYGKLRDYLCILGNKVDKNKFDEEFHRRFRQLYFYHEPNEFEVIKEELANHLDKLSQSYITALISIGNQEFVSYTLKQLDIPKYFNSIKNGEYANDYPQYLHEIISENTIKGNEIEKTLVCINNSSGILEPQFLIEKNISITKMDSMI